MLIACCQHGLDQCQQLAEQLGAADFKASFGSSSSVGAHLRHILDRYHSLLQGSRSGVVNYDARQRDHLVETQPNAAEVAIASLRRRLDSLQNAPGSPAEWLEQPLEVRETIDAHAHAVRSQSCLKRELMGLVSHTVHHLAIIALVCRQRGYSLDEDFGKAASTIAFENR